MIFFFTEKFVIMLLFLNTCYGQIGKTKISGSKTGEPLSGTISMGPPDLSDEETQSNFMPAGLKCDSCTAISVRFAKALKKDIEKEKAIREGKKEISEGRLIEIFEDICGDREWSNYGLKEIDGVNRIVYPDSELSEVPGIMQGGGQWPRRLADMCYAYIEKYEEYGIYKAYVRDPLKGISNLLCSQDCRINGRAMNEL